MSNQQDLYYAKYLKYKEKYMTLKEQIRGGFFGRKKKSIIEKILENTLENTYSSKIIPKYSVKLDSIQDMYIASTSDNSGNLNKLDDEKNMWSAQKISIDKKKPQIGKKENIVGKIYFSEHNDIKHNDIKHNDIKHNDIKHNYIISDNRIIPVPEYVYLIINNLYKKKEKEKENIIAFINKISIDDNLSKLINLVYLNMGKDVNKKSFSDRFIKPEYKLNPQGISIIDFNNLEPPVDAINFFTNINNPSIIEKKIIDLIFNSVNTTIQEEIVKNFNLDSEDSNKNNLDTVEENAYKQTYVNKNKDGIIVGIQQIKLLLDNLSFFIYEINLDYLIIKKL